MKGVAMLLMAVALLGGCRKKPALVKTPVSELDPLGGAVPPAPRPISEARVEDRPTPRPAAPTDAGVPKTVIVAPKTSNNPTVASPYIPGGGSQHLPLWKQRAKFY